MTPLHGCHPTRHDAARHARAQNRDRRDGRRYVIDRCACGRGWITTPYGAEVRRRRAAARRASKYGHARRWAA